MLIDVGSVKGFVCPATVITPDPTSPFLLYGFAAILQSVQGLVSAVSVDIFLYVWTVHVVLVL